MIATYAIIGLALAWMFWELRFWIRNGLVIGNIKLICPAMTSIEALITAREHLNNMILCSNCRIRCDKERWYAFTIPSKSIKAYGYTFNFLEGCNIKRSKTLHEVARAQYPHKPLTQLCKSNLTPPICGDAWIKRHANKALPEPTIEITVNGKALSVNGNYKRGIISDFMKANKLTKRELAK